MNLNKLLTTIALWSITTTVNFTTILAHYLLPKIQTTISTNKSNNNHEPSIWKQKIFCIQKRIYITNYDFFHKFRKIIENPHKIFVTKDGQYYYNTLECKTYGPIIIVGVTATIISGVLLLKLWKTYYQTAPLAKKTLIMTPEQQTFLTTPTLQTICNAKSITYLPPLSRQNKIATNAI